MAGTKKRHRWRRRPLALPYASAPAVGGGVHFDPSVHTAAELMQERTPAA
jgi:hypothetical protein